MSIEVEIDLRDEFSEVRDQGQLPTCLSYATTSVHWANKQLDDFLSPEALHYYATEAEWQSGSKIEEIQQALYDEGQPEIGYCDTITHQNCSDWRPPERAPHYQSSSENKSPSTEAIIKSIRNRKYPVMGLGLSGHFYRPSPPWVISAGTTKALHAVVGVGLGKYEGETVILIRNSWGSEWGNSGHAWLGTSYLDQHLREVLLLQSDKNT
jgi:hypothetical protein